MTREQLLASLTGVKSGGWYGDDDRYVDWSTRTEAGEFQVEVGDGNDAVVLTLSRAELADLHRALTVALLTEEVGS